MFNCKEQLSLPGYGSRITAEGKTELNRNLQKFVPGPGNKDSETRDGTSPSVGPLIGIEFYPFMGKRLNVSCTGIAHKFVEQFLQLRTFPCRLLLIQEKEQLLRELRSVKPKGRSTEVSCGTNHCLRTCSLGEVHWP